MEKKSSNSDPRRWKSSVTQRLEVLLCERKVEIQALKKKHEEDQKLIKELKLRNSTQISPEESLLELSKKLEAVNQLKNELIAVLARTRQDEFTITGTDRPRNDLLVHKFRSLEEQDFHFIAITLCSIQPQRQLALNRKHQMSKIKYILSREIFMQKESFYLGTNPHSEIKSSVAQKLRLNEAYVTKDIVQSIDTLIEKALQLIRQIMRADPPGTLWVERKGEEFNSEFHRAVLGCEEFGKIQFTVYPGYKVGKHLFEKALVFTKI